MNRIASGGDSIREGRGGEIQRYALSGIRFPRSGRGADFCCREERDLSFDGRNRVKMRPKLKNIQQML